jgi:CBS domain-containing protein
LDHHENSRQAAHNWDAARHQFLYDVLIQVNECAASNIPVVISAPCGTGKSALVAKLLHAFCGHGDPLSRQSRFEELARLYMARQFGTRRSVRKPVVADIMLPPSEVPDCRPDTTVIEALEQLVQSGTQALPVCEASRVVGIVTLANLATNISDRQGTLSVAGTIRTLMRPATIVPPGTPLPEIAQAIATDGIIVVSGPSDRPAGYLTAESVLTQAPPVTSDRLVTPDHTSLLIPGTGSGAVLLGHNQ